MLFVLHLFVSGQRLSLFAPAGISTVLYAILPYWSARYDKIEKLGKHAIESSLSMEYLVGRITVRAMGG